MTSHALARQSQHVTVETLPPASAMDVVKQHPSPITQYLVERQHMIEPLLPPGIRFLTVVWEVVTALAKDQQQNKPALVHCTPDSVFLAVTKIQAWGLEIGRTAHLVPFSKTCTPILDYKGDIQLAVDAGVITHCKAGAVFEGEEFLYEEGLTPILRHVPSLKAQQRGQVLGFYAILTLPTREKVATYMPLKDVDDIRLAHSKQWKTGPCPIWYGKKTVIKQALKTVPKSTRRDALLANIERANAMDIANADAITATMVDAPELETIGGEQADTSTGEITTPQLPTIDQAVRVPFPFHKGKPVHGRPLGELETEMLTKVAHWIVEQQDAKDDPTFHLETLNAINVIVDAREQAGATTSDEPPTGDDPELGLDEAPKGAPAGSLSYKVPPGGKVEDTLPLDDRRGKPSRNAQEI